MSAILVSKENCAVSRAIKIRTLSYRTANEITSGTRGSPAMRHDAEGHRLQAKPQLCLSICSIKRACLASLQQVRSGGYQPTSSTSFCRSVFPRRPSTQQRRSTPSQQVLWSLCSSPRGPRSGAPAKFHSLSYRTRQEQLSTPTNRRMMRDNVCLQVLGQDHRTLISHLVVRQHKDLQIGKRGQRFRQVTDVLVGPPAVPEPQCCLV